MDINSALASKNKTLGNTGFLTPAFCCKGIDGTDFPDIKAPPNDPSLQCAKNLTQSTSNYMKVSGIKGCKLSNIATMYMIGILLI